MDLMDLDLRLLALEVFKENETTVADLLSEALAAAEIGGCNPQEFAPTILTVTLCPKRS